MGAWLNRVLFLADDEGNGAKTVIAVGPQQRLKMAGKIGADVLIDYEKEDPVKRVLEVTDYIRRR